MNSRPDLQPSDVAWRIDSEPFDRDGDVRARYVPYLQAHTVAAMLDAWVGADRWHDTYEEVEIRGKLAIECALTVHITDGHMTTKRDVGTAPNYEPEKGAYSDAFKRVVCIKWGVGREVYRMEGVWAPCRVTDAGKARPLTGEAGAQVRDSLLAEAGEQLALIREAAQVIQVDEEGSE